MTKRATKIEPTEDPFLSANEVARQMNVHHTTIGRWIKEGAIPALRTPGGHWMIRLSAIRKWIQASTFKVTIKPPEDQPCRKD